MKFQLIFVFLYISGFGYAQSDVYYFKDSSSSLTYETIKNKEFKILKEQILEKYSDDTYWFKIPAYETDSTYIFKILYERYNHADVYQNSKKIEKLQNQRFLSYQFSREYDVYFKINPKLHSYIPFELLSEEKSILKNNNQLLINGFYYGFAFLIIVYNLFYYYLFKDDAFLYYSLFLATIAFGVFAIDGMLNFYNIIGSANDFIMILNYIFLAFFTCKFVNSYLLLERYYPKLEKISYLIGVIIIILGVLYLNFKNFYYLLFLGILVFSLLLVYWVSAVLLFSKNRYTKILVLSYIIILFSGIDYYVLKFLGISIINIDAKTIKIGSFLEMIILSVAVLYRMKVLKDENEFMRSEIVNYSKEIEYLKINNELVKRENSLENLSIREKEIFDLIVLGKPNKEIANTLNVSINTVKFHIKNIYDKLHIRSRKEAISLDKSLQ